MAVSRVLISYSHDSPEHKHDVLRLSQQLRVDGLNVIIDQDHDWIPEGWTLWMHRQIEEADFVLVICTEKYCRRAEGQEVPPTGAGATWEGAIVRLDLYEANGHNRKFIPVLMQPADDRHRPFFLRDYPSFLATDRDSYSKLSALLRGPEAQPALVPSVWNIPPSDLNFFGRQQYLEALRNTLTSGTQAAALTQPIKGLGGIGKTQTALKYAALYRHTYSAGFWVVADSHESLVTGFAEFARLLDLPARNDREIGRTAAAAKRWFESNDEPHRRWLLIFDNVEDWEVTRPWIPFSQTGHVLITTRLQHTGKLVRGLDLPKMPPEEGAQFLLSRSKIDPPSDRDLSAALDISREFGGLPLGLEQAGAYIEEAGLSPAEYLELYRREGKTLRDRPGASQDHDTVTRTFSVAAQMLDRQSQEILQRAAYLAPDAIPEELLTDGDALSLEFRDALAGIVRWSLVRRNPSTKSIDIHRLVQDVVRDTMDPALTRERLETVASSLSRCFPDKVEFKDWPLFDRLLPHARAVAAEVTRLGVLSAAAARLCNQCGWYVSERAQYKEAEPLFKKALEIRRELLGPDHPDTATSVSDLGSMYARAGMYKEAEPLLKKALEARERLLGPEDPITAITLNNLGVIYGRQERTGEAERLLLRALAIRETALGPEDPETAQALGNLASVYQTQQQFEKVEALLARALKIRQQALEPAHPDLAFTLNQLGTFYVSQGQHADAEALFIRALDISERSLGPDHPQAAPTLNNLADVHLLRGELQVAESLSKRALHICEQALGPDHPETGTALYDLATVYLHARRFQHAAPLLTRALAIKERLLGPQHSSVIGLAKVHAQVLQKIGRGFEANKVRKRYGIEGS